jgi:hypothetical protein
VSGPSEAADAVEESSVSDERLRFVARVLDGETTSPIRHSAIACLREASAAYLAVMGTRLKCDWILAHQQSRPGRLLGTADVLATAAAWRDGALLTVSPAKSID